LLCKFTDDPSRSENHINIENFVLSALNSAKDFDFAIPSLDGSGQIAVRAMGLWCGHSAKGKP